MTEPCRKFGISRKTGYKLFDPYQECAVQGLTERSRVSYRYAAPRPPRQRPRSNLLIARARAGHIFVLRRTLSASALVDRALRFCKSQFSISEALE
jgi:hypothetical protein